MPLTFSSVRSLAGALATGIMKSVNWVFRFLKSESERAEFITTRFPNLPERTRNFLLREMESSYQQGIRATAGEMPQLADLRLDPTHTGSGRVAVNVFLTARGWASGQPGKGRPPDLFHRFVTLYYGSVPTLEQIDRDIQSFAQDQVRQDYEQQFRGTNATITSVSMQITNMTRSD